MFHMDNDLDQIANLPCTSAYTIWADNSWAGRNHAPRTEDPRLHMPLGGHDRAVMRHEIPEDFAPAEPYALRLRGEVASLTDGAADRI